MPIAVLIEIKYLSKMSLQLVLFMKIKRLFKMLLQLMSSILQIKEAPYILFKIQSGENIDYLFNIDDELNI
jgi:L-lysine 2,3-aminomutase